MSSAPASWRRWATARGCLDELVTRFEASRGVGFSLPDGLPRLRSREPARRALLHACGSPIAAAPARVQEERKLVTVLFADLVGFTSRSEQLDPEDVRAMLSPYYARLRAELERHGGTVEKFIGDAVMAVFGAPVAHEDDPERAVRAALAIRDWVAEAARPQVRVAVTTGEALGHARRPPGEGEGMAAGDVVNTAARLQSAAPVDGMLVGERTYRATRAVIEYREREPVRGQGEGGADPGLGGGGGALAPGGRRGAGGRAARRPRRASSRCCGTRSTARATSERAAARDDRRRARASARAGSSTSSRGRRRRDRS